METQLLNLFPVPMMIIENIGSETTTEDLKRYDIDHSSGPRMQNLSHQMNVLNMPDMDRLKAAILPHVMRFLYGELSIQGKYELDFVSSWVSRLKKGAQHTEHFHPCSQFSGVFYPCDQEGASAITFVRPIIDPQWIGGNLIPDLDTYTYKNCAQHTFPANADSLIIFPSHQPHRVDWNFQSEGDERYSLAFNLMLSGEYTTPAQTVRIKAEPL